MRSLLLLTPALLASSLGCRAHLVLDELPAPSAPLVQRAAAYERVKPSPLVAGDPLLPSLLSANGGVVLANGVIVDDPMALAPLVPADGPTMRHARAARDLERATNWVGAAGVGIGVLGIAGELVGGSMLLGAAGPGGTPTGPAAEVGVAVTIGSAVVGVGALLASIAPVVYLGVQAVDERAAAFSTYEPDLRARLALVEP